MQVQDVQLKQQLPGLLVDVKRNNGLISVGIRALIGSSMVLSMRKHDLRRRYLSYRKDGERLKSRKASFEAKSTSYDIQADNAADKP